MKVLSLLSKIKRYHADVRAAGIPISASKASATLGAIWSYLIWGTSFSEYFGYRFWSRSRKEKQTYMTRRHMFRFFDQYNPEEFRSRIGDKSLAVKYYGSFMNREQFVFLQGYDAFLQFTKAFPRIFIKKAVGWGGEGARIEEIDSSEKAESVWNTLSPEYVVEPVLENHPLIRAINPSCLNTIKFTTLVLSNGPEIQSALIRFGNGTIVDNVHSGGMVAGINLQSGQIETSAIDRHFHSFPSHPVTGKPIKGATVPFFPEAAALALRAASVTPELRYCSWDIAITPEGPVLIEGNWDAEFYGGQVVYDCGNRTRFIRKLEGR